MDAFENPRLRPESRTLHHRDDGNDSGHAAASGDGLSLVPGNPAFGKDLFRRAAGGGLPEGRAMPGIQLSKLEIDSQERTGSGARARYDQTTASCPTRK